jgi:hypothetical protein
LTIALSIAEAGYISAYIATQEVIYLQMLLKDLEHEQKELTTIYQEVIMIRTNQISNQRSKYINIKYYYV